MPPKKQNEHKTEDAESSGDEFASTAPRISFTDLEKSMTSFNGDDAYGIENWIKEFEDIATLMEWSNLEKLVYSKRLLSGTARLFLRSLQGVTKWENLRKELREEFGSNLNSAALHKRLASRKMKNTETYQQYFLHMKEIALLGSVEDEALMEYVIDGIRDTETNKSILYGATNMKEFRKKLEIYSEIRKKTDTKTHDSYSKPATPGTPKTEHQKLKMRCYNCGATDHFSKDCTKGIKCFKCNDFGHKSTECSKKEKQQLTIQEKGKDHCFTPYKDVHINEAAVKALIDTGSDVNLIKEFYLEKINCQEYNHDATTYLKGIADHKIQTRGSISAKIQIDDSYFDATIHVVQNDDIPVNVILGNPILNDVEINFTAEGITTKKIMRLTTTEDLAEHSLDVTGKEITEENKKLIQDYPKNPQKKSNVELKIITDDDALIQQNPRRLSPLELDEDNKQITELKSQSPVLKINDPKLKTERNEIVTDCSPLTMTLKKKDLPPRVARYTDTASRLKRAQNDNLKIKLIKKVLDNEPYEDYTIEDGIVCKMKDGNELIVVPKKMQTEIIRKIHEKGHFGIVKTEELILRGYYYIDYLKDKIKAVIDNCEECILLSHKRRKKKGYLQPIEDDDLMKPWVAGEDSSHSSEADE